MANWLDKFPDCYGGVWVDPYDGERLGVNVDLECVARKLSRDPDRTIATKAELREIVGDGDISRYMEFDNGIVMVKVVGQGWFAIPAGREGVKVLARNLTLGPYD